MISTANLSGLPVPGTLRKALQSMAVLDAALEAEWEYRYYSFNARWSPMEQMGSMRNGCGDDFFAVFDHNGCFLKGFAHESPMSPWRSNQAMPWPGVLDAVPQRYSASLSEPAFKIQDTTFCIWRGPDENVWQVGPVAYPAGDDPDGSKELLSPLDGKPSTYRDWAESYFERPVPLHAVVAVFQHSPLTSSLLAELRSPRSLADMLGELEEIAYPFRPDA